MSSNRSTNASNSAPHTVIFEWGTIEIFNLLIAVLGTLFNGTAIFLFLFRRTPFSSFAVYLINLLIANLLQTTGTKLAAALLFVWPAFHNNRACDFYNFSSHISMAIVIHTHLFISMNRLWAVLWPLSYRTKHTPGFACCACVSIWAYSTAALLPQLVLDSLYYRIPIDLYRRCFLNMDQLRSWITTTQVVIFVLPEVLILATFPLILKRRRNRRAKVSRLKTVTEEAATEKVNEGPDRGVADVAPGARESNRKSGKSFTVFFLLMVSMFVCWTPLLVPTLVACFIDLESPSYFRVAAFIFSVEALIDPVIFVSVFTDTRRILPKFFGCSD